MHQNPGLGGRRSYLSAVLVLGGLGPFLPCSSRETEAGFFLFIPLSQAQTKTSGNFIAPQSPYLRVSRDKGHWGLSKATFRRVTTWRFHCFLTIHLPAELLNLSLDREGH